MLMAIILGMLGLALSALFSGTETGFYRSTRVRLVLDARSGDWIARGLLFLSTHPSLFVATVLVGNNVANYLVSAAIVMATDLLYTGGGNWPHLLAPLVLAPVLFIYGELLPKDLFFQAPNRLLRKAGPIVLGFAVIFLPISSMLFALSKLLEKLAGESPETVQSTLARRELQRVLDEGHAVGVLHPAQRQLAQGLFAAANQPAGSFATPLARVIRARFDMSKERVIQLAKRYGLTAIPVESFVGGKTHWGYVRLIDLRLSDSAEIAPIRPLLRIRDSEPHIGVLTRMQTSGEPLGLVVNSRGEPVGIVSARSLISPLLREER